MKHFKFVCLSLVLFACAANDKSSVKDYRLPASGTPSIGGTDCNPVSDQASGALAPAQGAWSRSFIRMQGNTFNLSRMFFTDATCSTASLASIDSISGTVKDAKAKTLSVTTGFVLPLTDAAAAQLNANQGYCGASDWSTKGKRAVASKACTAATAAVGLVPVDSALTSPFALYDGEVSSGSWQESEHNPDGGYESMPEDEFSSYDDYLDYNWTEFGHDFRTPEDMEADADYQECVHYGC